MDVNFTGLRNIYGLKYNELIKNGSNISDVNERVFLNVHLRDDKYGNDLSEFKSAISTTDATRTRHPVNSDFINISTEKTPVGSQNRYKIFINGSEMNVNRQNMRFFTYLAKLLHKIQEIPESKLIVNEDFKNGEDVYNSLILDKNIQAEYGRYIPKMFTHNNITSRAKELMDNLQDCMEQYLKV